MLAGGWDIAKRKRKITRKRRPGAGTIQPTPSYPYIHGRLTKVSDNDYVMCRREQFCTCSWAKEMQ